MRLLLDEHLPPPLATQLSRHGIDAVALRDWEDGRWLRIRTTIYCQQRGRTVEWS
ncbi:MAG: DUF5615 family PIN-like protein [Chloroflexi bacterium]|nr:DUF5615 family PIN-like protein [Chloroflexota bacterium]